MDVHRFDQLSKAFVRVTGRRSLTRALAGLPLLGTGGLLADDTTARRKRLANTEKKNKKKCNGELTRCTVKKGKRKKAVCANTRTDNAHCGGCGITCGTGQTCIHGQCGGGACLPEAEDVTCAGKCGQVVNNCGTPVECPSWINESTFGSSGTAANQFQRPWDVAVTEDGLTALIADTSNHRISVWTRSGAGADWEPQTQFGSHGTASNQFDYPHGVAISADGLTALITDDRNRVLVWRRSAPGSIDWESQTRFGGGGEGDNQFLNPVGIALTADGLTSVVADLGNHRVSVWRRSTPDSVDWAHQTTFGGWDAGDDQLRFPHDVAVSVDGLTALITNDNHLVSVWRRTTASSTDWTPQTRFGSRDTGDNQYTYLAWVAISADGLIAWVADYRKNSISVWERPAASSIDWAHQTNFGSYGTGANHFIGPLGVAVSPDGLSAWVADWDNNRISVWTRICPT